MKIKEADLVTMGLCSNSGDVLISAAVEKLFEGSLRFRLRPVRTDTFDNMSDNILIGAGGLLTGSPNVTAPHQLLIRHLSVEKIQAWQREEKRLICFGTGTNADFLGKYRPITEKSGLILSALGGFNLQVQHPQS